MYSIMVLTRSEIPTSTAANVQFPLLAQELNYQDLCMEIECHQQVNALIRYFVQSMCTSQSNGPISTTSSFMLCTNETFYDANYEIPLLIYLFATCFLSEKTRYFNVNVSLNLCCPFPIYQLRLQPPHFRLVLAFYGNLFW